MHVGAGCAGKSSGRAGTSRAALPSAREGACVCARARRCDASRRGRASGVHGYGALVAYPAPRTPGTGDSLSHTHAHTHTHTQTHTHTVARIAQAPARGPTRAQRRTAAVAAARRVRTRLRTRATDAAPDTDVRTPDTGQAWMTLRGVGVRRRGRRRVPASFTAQQDCPGGPVRICAGWNGCEYTSDTRAHEYTSDTQITS